MTIQEYHKLRAHGRMRMHRSREFNPLPSGTDPTQDCPVSAFQFGPDGSVINCRKNNLPYNQVPIEQMTAIESRQRDKFDVLGQQQQLAQKASKGLSKATKKQL